MTEILENTSGYPVYFIVEIGQNHQGSLEIAKQMVDSLKGLGVSAIKAAKRDIDVCLTDAMKNMPYDHPHSFGKTYYEHRQALELSRDDFLTLKNYVEAAGFDFISSYTDLPSLEFLIEIGVKILKVASQRLTDMKLLRATAEFDLPMVISTGMSSLADVDRAVNLFADHELYLLQCTSTYPCQESELNLNVIKTYQERYRDKVNGVGFSGHHTGIAADIAAYLLGATIIERHYTLDRSMKGTDHAGSLEVRGIELVLKYIKQVQTALGSSDKTILESESNAIKKLRADLLEH